MSVHSFIEFLLIRSNHRRVLRGICLIKTEDFQKEGVCR